MGKVKKYGLISLIINLIFTVGGGVLLIFAWKAVNNADFSGIDAPDMGMMGMLIVALVGAALLVVLFLPFAHLVLGGFNSLMMLLQVLTEKRGFSVLPIITGVLLVLIDGTFLMAGVGMILEGGVLFIAVFAPLVALSLGSIVLNIKSLEKNNESE